MTKRRNTNKAPSSDVLPPSVGQFFTSSPLSSDASTPSPPPRYNHHRNFTQNLDSSSVYSSSTSLDKSEDYGEGIGNLTVYTSFPTEALGLFQDEDKKLIPHKFAVLKAFMKNSGKEFHGVEVRRYETLPGQGKEIENAEKFEEEFFDIMLSQAELDTFFVLEGDDLQSLCKQQSRWVKQKEETEQIILTEDEKEKHKELTKRFTAGICDFIKRQYKERGETAFDDAVNYSTFKTVYLPKILLEMSLNSAKNDQEDFRTLFMTGHEGAKCIKHAKWPAYTTFNKIMKEKNVALKEEALRAKEVEVKHNNENAVSHELISLQSELKKLRVQNNTNISSFQDSIALLHEQNEELRGRIAKLKNENQRLNERIMELEGRPEEVATESNNMHMPTHGGNIFNFNFSTPAKAGNHVNIFPTPVVPKNEEE